MFSKFPELVLLVLVCLGMPVLSGAEAPPVNLNADADFEQKLDRYLASDRGRQAVSKIVESYLAAKQAQAPKVQQQSTLEEQFKNPVKIDLGQSPSKGPKDALITIVEFSDFQCPFCTRGRNTLEEVAAAYPGKIKIVFKNLPLAFHKNALPAAKAALAAERQGKFWEFYDEFFANQGKLSPEFYAATVRKFGLNEQKFFKDMIDPALDKLIEEDKAQANKNGITGTPAFFVNGILVKGAKPLSYFKTIIDRLLATPQK